MDNNEHKEVTSPGLEMSPAEEIWEAFAARFREGMKQVPGWTEDNLGMFSRTVQMPEGSFALTHVGPTLMGGSTMDEYECNLMPLFEELGIANYFETFRLFCGTHAGYAEKLSARLKPKQDANIPMDVVLTISPPPRREKKRDQMRSQSSTTLRLEPQESSGSPYVRTNFIGMPGKSPFQLSIRIREVPENQSRSEE